MQATLLIWYVFWIQFWLYSMSITYSITGISLGFCIRNNKKVYSTIAIVAVASLIGTIINIALFMFFIEKLIL